MPLIQRRSERAFEHNVRAEIAAGKPPAQALAIAYAVQGKVSHVRAIHGADHMRHGLSHAERGHP